MLSDFNKKKFVISTDIFETEYTTIELIKKKQSLSPTAMNSYKEEYMHL